MTIYDLINIYVDYRNNYLTIEGYASRNNLTLENAECIIKEAKRVYIEIYG